MSVHSSLLICNELSVDGSRAVLASDLYSKILETSGIPRNANSSNSFSKFSF